MYLRRTLFVVVLGLLAGCNDKSLPPEPETVGDLRDVFARAITAGDQAEVQELLATQPLLLNEPLATRNNLTPLHFAAAANQESIIRYLLEQGADPYAQDDEGQYPSDLAVMSGASESVVALLRVQ